MAEQERQKIYNGMTEEQLLERAQRESPSIYNIAIQAKDIAQQTGSRKLLEMQLQRLADKYKSNDEERAIDERNRARLEQLNLAKVAENPEAEKARLDAQVELDERKPGRGIKPVPVSASAEREAAEFFGSSLEAPSSKELGEIRVPGASVHVEDTGILPRAAGEEGEQHYVQPEQTGLPNIPPWAQIADGEGRFPEPEQLQPESAGEPAPRVFDPERVVEALEEGSPESTIVRQAQGMGIAPEELTGTPTESKEEPAEPSKASIPLVMPIAPIDEIPVTPLDKTDGRFQGSVTPAPEAERDSLKAVSDLREYVREVERGQEKRDNNYNVRFDSVERQLGEQRGSIEGVRTELGAVKIEIEAGLGAIVDEQATLGSRVDLYKENAEAMIMGRGEKSIEERIEELEVDKAQREKINDLMNSLGKDEEHPGTNESAEPPKKGSGIGYIVAGGLVALTALAAGFGIRGCGKHDKSLDSAVIQAIAEKAADERTEKVVAPIRAQVEAQKKESENSYGEHKELRDALVVYKNNLIGLEEAIKKYEDKINGVGAGVTKGLADAKESFIKSLENAQAEQEKKIKENEERRKKESEFIRDDIKKIDSKLDVHLKQSVDIAPKPKEDWEYDAGAYAGMRFPIVVKEGSPKPTYIAGIEARIMHKSGFGAAVGANYSEATGENSNAFASVDLTEREFSVDLKGVYKLPLSAQWKMDFNAGLRLAYQNAQIDALINNNPISQEQNDFRLKGLLGGGVSYSPTENIDLTLRVDIVADPDRKANVPVEGALGFGVGFKH